MRAWTSPLLLVLAAGGWAANARAEETPTPASVRADVSQSSGPAIGLGIGNQTPILGAQIDYYWSPDPVPIHFAGYIGALAGGILGFIGHHHRLLVDLGYGYVATEYQFQNTPLCCIIQRETRHYGINAAVGYEYMSSGGFFVRVSGGVAYVLDQILAPGANRLGPTFNLTLGIKLY